MLFNSALLKGALTLYDQADIDATIQAFCLVGIAEIFDKTWFVALLMALKFDKNIVFWSCLLGLAAHVVIAAGLGFAAAKFIPVRYLNFGAALLYIYFAYLFYQDFQNADPDSDIISAGKEEAAEDCEIEEDGTQYGSTDAKKEGKKAFALTGTVKVFFGCFMAMFIAEWGDRTQIAMIGLHASKPVIPVCIGSFAAFFLLTLSAVIVGGLLANQKLSEKMVHGISAMAFLAFAGLAAHDGLTAPSA